jgi:DNA replication protein DnaC
MEMSLAELQRNLKTVRLHGMSATLETRLIQANQGASFAEVFACLVQDEMDWRNSRLIETRFKASGLLDRPTLTEFDWGFNPKLPKQEIYELVSGKFIRDGADALLIGSPGTGKSHIAKTVGPCRHSNRLQGRLSGSPCFFRRSLRIRSTQAEEEGDQALLRKRSARD